MLITLGADRGIYHPVLVTGARAGTRLAKSLSISQSRARVSRFLGRRLYVLHQQVPFGASLGMTDRGVQGRADAPCNEIRDEAPVDAGR
jgi:hypothetical protein